MVAQIGAVLVEEDGTKADLEAWMRDAGQSEAADLLEQCDLRLHYVDTWFEVGSERDIDVSDVDILAPAAIYSELSGSLKWLTEQVEGTISECVRSLGFIVRNVSWLPKLGSSTVSPAQMAVSETLGRIDSVHVHRAWDKALHRVKSDPDGALTAARSLLESVCKHVLDERGIAYSDSAGLPRLFRDVLDKLDLAPSQQQDDALKAVLGNCEAIVSRICSLRNSLGDAHGHGQRAPLPSPAQAELAVNLAGAVSAFVVAVRAASLASSPPDPE